jgi:hypothetical protein
VQKHFAYGKMNLWRRKVFCFALEAMPFSFKTENHRTPMKERSDSPMRVAGYQPLFAFKICTAFVVSTFHSMSWKDVNASMNDKGTAFRRKRSISAVFS